MECQEFVEEWLPDREDMLLLLGSEEDAEPCDDATEL